MFSSFFILILAFPWLLISYIRFTKWTPAFALGGSVNQLNGQAEPHVIMACVLHLFKIQVSLTEQSCIIPIFFVSCIKDFFSPSCWRLWEGYTTHSRARNFWLLPSVQELGLEEQGWGRQSSIEEELEGPCQGSVSVCPAAGTVPSSLGKGKGCRACRKGQLVVALPALCPLDLHLAGCAAIPCRRALCMDTSPMAVQGHSPWVLSHALCVQSWAHTGSSGQFQLLLLFPLLWQDWAAPAAGHLIAETSGDKLVCKQMNQKSYLNRYWNN